MFKHDRPDRGCVPSPGQNRPYFGLRGLSVPRLSEMGTKGHLQCREAREAGPVTTYKVVGLVLMWVAIFRLIVWAAWK